MLLLDVLLPRSRTACPFCIGLQTLLNRLRVELSIGTDCHKQWMTELLTAKRAGTLGV